MITDVMERHIKNLCSEYVNVVVRNLSTKYKFDADEAISTLDLPVIKRGEAAPARRKEAVEKPKKASRVVPSIPLPFCGVVNDTWCHAIAKNKNLFTQCTNLKEEQNDYCKKCSTVASKEGTMPFGVIESRLTCDLMEYTDPKGVKVVPYAVIMKKLNITRETAETEATKFGWSIDPRQYVVAEKSRGRPKKSSDDESSQDEEKKAAKRGRPKKDKPMKASSQVGDDIIAGLLAQANANQVVSSDASSEDTTSEQMEAPIDLPVDEPIKTKITKEDKAAAKAAKEAEKEAAKAAKEAAKAAKEAEKEAAKAAKKNDKKTKKNEDKVNDAPPPAPTVTKKQEKITIPPPQPVAEQNSQEEYSESEEEEAEAEVIKVKKFEFEGKKYKRSEPDNVLYDWDTNEPIGVWNSKTNKIDELPSDESDEDEDDE